MKLDTLESLARWRRFPVFVSAILVGASAVSRDWSTLLSRMLVDDSFYYLEIAKNVARGHGFTFDGLNPTNGFHPLFQLLLVPVFWVFEGGVPAVYAAKSIEVLLLGTTAMLFARLCRRLWGDHSITPWLAVGLLLMPSTEGTPICRVLLLTMEGGVNALALLVVLNVFVDHRLRTTTTDDAVRMGLALGLALWARLDNVFLLGAYGVLLEWLARRAAPDERSRLRRYAWVSVMVAVAIIAPVLVYNTLQFGSPMPISGQVKAFLSREIAAALLDQGIGALLRNTLWIFTGAGLTRWIILANVLAASVMLALRRPLALRAHAVQVHGLLLTASVAKLTYYSLAHQYPLNTPGWYYVLDLLALMLTLAFAAERVAHRWLSPKRARACAAAFLGVAVVASAASSASLRPQRDWEVASFEAANEIRERVDPQAVIGAFDAGVLGYFLEQPVVNLDGVVNDRELLDYLRAGKLADYILDRRIEYVTNLLPAENDRFVRSLGAAGLELVYATPAPTEEGVYKLYRILPPAP